MSRPLDNSSRPDVPDPYAQILDSLQSAHKVLVTTHVRPDGDALGSVAALVLALRRKQIDASVLLLSHLPTKYAFIFNENQIPHTDVESGWPPALEPFDTLAVVDTGTWSQLPGLEQRLKSNPARKLVIDHHLTQENWADVKLVVTEAAAAAEVIAELLTRWPIAIDQAIAGALFLGLASDTGWFQFSNTRPHTLRLAADLMEKGVDTDRMYQCLYQNERPQRLALQTRAQESLELLADGRLAVMLIRLDDFRQTQANVPDTENLVNIPLQVASVQVSILIVEPPEGSPVRVSLRSKGQVDVARFAESFGGGGHARAAGLKVQGTIDQARQTMVQRMTEWLAR